MAPIGAEVFNRRSIWPQESLKAHATAPGALVCIRAVSSGCGIEPSRARRSGRPCLSEGLRPAAPPRAQPGTRLSKSELMEALWPKTFVEEANLTQHVYTLRRALGDRPDGAPYIETAPRRGYRLNADVRAWHESESAASLSPPVPAGPPAAESGHDTCRARWRTQTGHRSALWDRQCRRACRASRACGSRRGDRRAWPTSPARKSPAMRGSSAGQHRRVRGAVRRACGPRGRRPPGRACRVGHRPATARDGVRRTARGREAAGSYRRRYRPRGRQPAHRRPRHRLLRRRRDHAGRCCARAARATWQPS